MIAPLVISLVSAIVPDALGNVSVLSAVGSATVKVVSYASAVEPSNTIEPFVQIFPLTFNISLKYQPPLIVPPIATCPIGF